MTHLLSGISGKTLRLCLAASTLLLITFLNYKPFPIFIDEYASTLLASGIPSSDAHWGDTGKYENITPEQIRKENTLKNTVENTIVYDGGNGTFYYVTAHYFALVFGKSLGFFNSLRVLSVLVFSVMVFLFYRYTEKEYSGIHALTGSVILIFLGYEYGFFARFYIICAFFQLILLYKTIMLKPENDSPGLFFLLILLCILLPHLHFFSLLFIGEAFLILAWKYFREGKGTYLIKYLAGIALSGVFFLWFYKYPNHVGRLERQSFNNYWKDFVLKYPSPENNWLAPTSVETLYRENTSLLLNYFGLDFQTAFEGLNTSYLTLLLLIPFAILVAFMYYAKPRSFTWLAAGFSLSFLLVLNVLRGTSFYLLALNFQWYYYIILPFLVFWLADAVVTLFQSKKVVLKALAGVYLVLLGFCTIAKSMKLYHTGKSTYESKVTRLFDKVERQFD